MLTSSTKLKAYFRQLATEHVDIVEFVYGSSERVLSRQTSKVNYPLLWMAIPDKIKLPDRRQQISTSLWILDNSRQDFDEEERAMDKMEAIADDIFERLMYDADYGLFDFGKSQTVFQPKPRFSADNDWGWCMDLDVTLGDAGCYDPAKFGN